MVLILSHNSSEMTTEQVLLWGNYFGKKFYRLNGGDLINGSFNNLLRKFADIKVVFFRRYVSLNKTLSYQNLNLDKKHKSKLSNHVLKEYGKLYEYFLSNFSNAYLLSSLSDEKKLNKLIALKEAENVGFCIPKSIITNKKDDLKEFLNEVEQAIVKPMDECQFFLPSNSNDVHFKMLTEKVSTKNLDLIPQTFFPSFFQQKIEKDYEVRVFYLDGKCFSMAILSQENEKTEVDFRNYDDEFPNRTVSYKLPSEVEEKVIKLMQKLELKTGSIDLIKDDKGEFIFLEVNPNGQLGMVSYPCNYFIERYITKFLIKKSIDE